jgi:hypothetical protein
MWTSYLTFSASSPFLAASIQFGILGTLGEIIAGRVRQSPALAFSKPQGFLLKILGWAALGIYIKVMFLSAGAALDALTHYGLSLSELESAAAKSILMNVMMGPSMMIIHRLSDQAIDRIIGLNPQGWQGFEKSLWTLIWLWIPLHTFTFTQAPEVRVLIAALLSVLLGVVMGFFARGRSP